MIAAKRSDHRPRRDPRVFVAVRRSSAGGSPVARSPLIPHKVSSLRCGTLRGPRIHVVKMRRHSFAPRFNENYPLSRSFSLRVVGGNTPTPLRGCYTLALPCYLFIAHSNARFVKEQRRKIALVGVTPPHPREGIIPSRSLWGYYTPTPPSYCFIPLSCTRFVKE